MTEPTQQRKEAGEVMEIEIGKFYSNGKSTNQLKCIFNEYSRTHFGVEGITVFGEVQTNEFSRVTKTGFHKWCRVNVKGFLGDTSEDPKVYKSNHAKLCELRKVTDQDEASVSFEVLDAFGRTLGDPRTVKRAAFERWAELKFDKHLELSVTPTKLCV